MKIKMIYVKTLINKIKSTPIEKQDIQLFTDAVYASNITRYYTDINDIFWKVYDEYTFEERDNMYKHIYDSGWRASVENNMIYLKKIFPPSHP